MRGRNRPKGPNPLTRSYESNGPDVKIRGTPQHIADKYAQLARDALAAGDPVAAENYFQHGEHYFRIVSGAQEQNRPANGGGYASRAYDDEMDEGEDEGNGSSQNGQAYNGYDDGDPGQQPQPYDNRPDMNQDGRQGRDRFQNRDQRRFDNNGRQDYRRQDQPRQDYQRPDYQRQDYQRQDNPRQDNPRQDSQRQDNPRQDYQRPDYRQDSRADNRQERQDNGRQDYRQDRQDSRPDNRQEARQDARQDTRQDTRGDQGRYEAPRGEQVRPEARTESRPEARPERAPRRERRRDPAPAAVSEEPTGLPAFLMAPARPIASTEPASQPEPEAVADDAPVAKPRRRRRPRFEGVVGEEGTGHTPTDDTQTE